MGLRVAARDGGRLTAEAVFARNAMREIEVFLPLTFILASASGDDRSDGGWLVLLGLGWALGFTFSRCSTATACGWATSWPGPGW